MAKRVNQKRKPNKRKKGKNGLPQVNRNAAGIDVGNAEHYVAVPEGGDSQPVRKFGSFTADLHRMAQWLKTCGIETVVMQATGGLLDRPFSDSGGLRIPSQRGERTPYENAARTQDGCARMPMVTEAAHFRIIE
jgi:hypothetical protein